MRPRENVRGQRRERETETFEYIRSMLRELRGLAQGERAGMLSYLIEMAYVEVSDLLDDTSPAKEDAQGSIKREIKPPE